MSTVKLSKLNLLLSMLPVGVVLSSAWLVEHGYSLDLQKRYRKSHWFESIGTGALIRCGDKVDYLGGLYSLQKQLGLFIHPGAKTALAIQGKAHYLELSPKRVQLFGGPLERLPLWFKNYNWDIRIDYKRTSILPAEIGLVDLEHKSFTVKVSSPARAIMECLYSVPNSQSLYEVYELMEGLNNLRPALVQALLEACTSVKVKRLFLYLAKRAGHDWLSFVALDNVNLGSGKRSIVANGVYIPEYQITVPKELEAGYE